jgi:hypothetical protein
MGVTGSCGGASWLPAKFAIGTITHRFEQKTTSSGASVEGRCAGRRRSCATSGKLRERFLARRRSARVRPSRAARRTKS